MMLSVLNCLSIRLPNIESFDILALDTDRRHLPSGMREQDIFSCLSHHCWLDIFRG
jgi:hypothetical protein